LSQDLEPASQLNGRGTTSYYGRPPGSDNGTRERAAGSMPRSRRSPYALTELDGGFTAPLRQRWYVLVAALVLGLVGGYLVSASLTPRYEAVVTVLFTDPSSAQPGNDLQPDEAERLIATQAERGLSQRIVSTAAETLGMSNEDLLDAVTVTPQPTLFALQYTGEAATPTAAARIAEATAQAYADAKRDTLSQIEDDIAKRFEDRLNALDARVEEAATALRRSPGNRVARAQVNAAVTQRLDLQAQVDDLIEQSAASTLGIESIEEAVTTDTPVAPNPLQDAVLAAAVLTLLAAGVIWFLAGRDPRATSVVRAGNVLDVPLLGEIPPLDVTIDVSAGELPRDIDDSFDFLATKLRRVMHGSDHVFMLTSAQPHTGVSLVCLHLAAAAGRDLDGMTIALAKAAEHTDGLVPAAGRVPRNRAANLTELRRASDVLLIDSPPLLTHAEASNLALASDGVILVVSPMTSLKRLDQARSLIALLGVPLLGYIYNQMPHD
jgi:capsular polysaccharide biosynthesis protein